MEGGREGGREGGKEGGREGRSASWLYIGTRIVEKKSKKEIRSKHLTIVHGFRPEMENFELDQTAYHLKGHEKRSRMVQISAP